MIVKINSVTTSVGSAQDSGRARGPVAQAPLSSSGSAERVDISSLSARLQEVSAGESPVDTRRVAEIKQAIAEGRFQINPEKIADGLLASVRDMLGHPEKLA